jgi:thymidylate synthase
MQSYLDLLRCVKELGESRSDRTGTGTTSLFGMDWEHDMRTGFPLLTTKFVPLRVVFEELMWFLSGSTNNADLLAKKVTIWNEWSTAEECAKFGRKENDLGPVYGALWRNFDGLYGTNVQGVDQIADLLSEIVRNPMSRRLIVSGWHPAKAKQVSLPPCHTTWGVYCHSDGGMSLQLFARSIDIFLGCPFNIASYALLLAMLARVTDRVPRKLKFCFNDLHLYNNHHDQADLQLARTPYRLPTVELAMPPGDTPLERLLNFRWEHVTLNDYRHHDKIPAPVAV